MAALKISNFSYCFFRYYKSVCCSSVRLTQSFKHSNCLKSFRFMKQHALVPVFQVKALRNLCFSEVFYSSKASKGKPLNLESPIDYEKVSEETLQSLYDRFEELLEDSCHEDWDVNYSNGVLKVTIEVNCVYVINKQTPNRQIWLSSPKSGPKRYDYVNGTWIYKHDGVSLHKLLSEELSDLLQKEADFCICTYSS